MVQKILELLNGIYPLDFIKVEVITNEMFRCTAKQGEYFARITNYKGYGEQLEEDTYTNYLYKEGLGVSPAIVSINGKVVEKITFNNKEVLTVLYESAAGKHLSRNQWNAKVLKESIHLSVVGTSLNMEEVLRKQSSRDTKRKTISQRTC